METYQLTPNELAALDAKYGKPLGPVGSIKRDPWYPQYVEPRDSHPRLNRDHYLELKEIGKTDKEVCREVHISSMTLCDLKRTWELKNYRNRPNPKTVPCKLCGQPSKAKGLCHTHYGKLWRWNMQIKAYHVSNYDGYGEIVFAETPGQAKAKSVILDDDFMELSARRAKYADKYVDQGYVPKSVLLENGWWFECECGYHRTGETAIIVDGNVYCEKCKPKEDEQS